KKKLHLISNVGFNVGFFFYIEKQNKELVSSRRPVIRDQQNSSYTQIHSLIRSFTHSFIHSFPTTCAYFFCLSDWRQSFSSPSFCWVTPLPTPSHMKAP